MWNYLAIAVIAFVLGSLSQVTLPQQEKIVYRDVYKPAVVEVKFDDALKPTACSVTINDIEFTTEISFVDDYPNSTAGSIFPHAITVPYSNMGGVVGIKLDRSSYANWKQ